MSKVDKSKEKLSCIQEEKIENCPNGLGGIDCDNPNAANWDNNDVIANYVEHKWPDKEE